MERDARTEAAFDKIAEAMNSACQEVHWYGRWDKDLMDAIDTARGAMVPTAGPREDYSREAVALFGADRLTDILTTAVEGGINYWATVEVYKWDCPEEERRAEIFTQDEGKRYRVDLQTLAEGLMTLWNENNAPIDHPKEPWMKVPLEICMNKREDFVDFDAADADCMFQYSIFGSVVYG